MEEEKKYIPSYNAKKTKLGIEISNLDDTVIQPTEVVASGNQPSSLNHKIKHGCNSFDKKNDADESSEEVDSVAGENA